MQTKSSPRVRPLLSANIETFTQKEQEENGGNTPIELAASWIARVSDSNNTVDTWRLARISTAPPRLQSTDIVLMYASCIYCTGREIRKVQRTLETADVAS